MAVITIERYDRVTHKVSPVPTSGVVLATFTDLKNRPCAAVQWGARIPRCVSPGCAGEGVRRLLTGSGFIPFRRAAGGEVTAPPIDQNPMMVALVEIEPAEYVDARTEARNLCRNLGLDVENEHWDKASIGDFVRLAYAQGYVACETRLASPDIADVIAQALDDPGSVLERAYTSESVLRWSVRAVQQVVAHGMPRDIHRPVETLEETAS